MFEQRIVALDVTAVGWVTAAVEGANFRKNPGENRISFVMHRLVVLMAAPTTSDPVLWELELDLWEPEPVRGEATGQGNGHAQKAAPLRP